MGPWRLRTTCEVVAHEAPRRFAIAARNSMVHFHGEFAVESAPGGARLTITGRAEPAFAEREGIKLGKVAQPLRAALTGRSTSPPVFDVLAVLGREESLARLGDQLPT